jgi:hypothetical protein
MGQQAHIDLDALANMDLSALQALWRDTFAGALPPGRAIDLMRLEIAWRVQVDRYGDLDKASKRVLRGRARTEAKRDARPATTRAAARGSTLLRAWRGRTYLVKVTDEGFIYDGRLYRSLSRIAREITGLSRSGPLFFGLKDE